MMPPITRQKHYNKSKALESKRMMNWVVAVVLMCLAPNATAARYDIDHAHSTVSFKIRHLGTKVPGWFTDFKGTIDANEKDITKSFVEATIQVASIDTRIAKRDAHLKSADFFDAAKYPVMTFKSTKVTKTGKHTGKVQGILSMHGVDKPVTLNVDYAGEMKAPGGAIKAGWSATAKINRKDFGIVWNQLLETGGFLLGDEVEISIDIEAGKLEPKAP